QRKGMKMADRRSSKKDTGSKKTPGTGGKKTTGSKKTTATRSKKTKGTSGKRNVGRSSGRSARPSRAKSAGKILADTTAAAATPGLAEVERERAFLDELIRRVVRECPRRQPTSEDEARALDIFLEELAEAGLETSEHHFEFNDSLYKNLVLHAGLGVAGTAVSGAVPLAGLSLHLLAAGSYLAESTRKAYVLRRLFRFKPSRNVLGVLPAEGDPALRIVLLGHADAAFTGMTFWPSIVRLSAMEGPEKLKFLRRGVQLMVTTQFMLAGCDAARMLLGPLALPLRPIEYVLTLPSVLALVLNGHVVLKNEIVPGANDNLSGSAALPVLARRLAPVKHPDVELVFCVTGCEEASLGGADALARDMEGVWDKERTVVIALDSLSNGDLRYLDVEGEVRPRKIPRWLSSLIEETAAADPRFSEVTGYEVPVGGSDAAAFQARGWNAVGLTCLDPEYGPPREYHLPTDDPEHLDLDKILFSIDFAEKLVERLMASRLG
ncbi:MAG: M28 family metallopeptidase, partial [Myxococcota bacterium]